MKHILAIVLLLSFLLPGFSHEVSSLEPTSGAERLPNLTFGGEAYGFTSGETSRKFFVQTFTDRTAEVREMLTEPVMDGDTMIVAPEFGPMIPGFFLQYKDFYVLIADGWFAYGFYTGEKYVGQWDCGGSGGFFKLYQISGC